MYCLFRKVNKISKGLNVASVLFFFPPSLSFSFLPIPVWLLQLASGGSECYVNSLDYLLQEKR